MDELKFCLICIFQDKDCSIAEFSLFGQEKSVGIAEFFFISIFRIVWYNILICGKNKQKKQVDIYTQFGQNGPN